MSAFTLRHSKLAVQQLEARALMAASLTASFNASEGILRVEGTYGNDKIHVRHSAGDVKIDGIKIAVTNGDVTSPAASVPRAQITRIVVAALDGNDTVQMHDILRKGESAIPLVIHGGMGNDSLIGGKGDDIIYGESGVDSIWGGAGRDLLYGDGNPDAAKVTQDYALRVSNGQFNSLGKQEKWVAPKFVFGESYPEYYVTPDGTLYLWTPDESAEDPVVEKLDPTYYVDLSKWEAEKGLYDLDLYYGWGLRDEKWLTGIGDSYTTRWYFVTPVGEVYRWDGLAEMGPNPSTGALIANLDFSYNADPRELVASATDDGAKDVIYGESDSDTLYGGAGSDSLLGGDGDDSLWGENGNDKIWGNWGNDMIYGQKGNDSLAGGADQDTLVGGENDDSIDGGIGNDSLWGAEYLSSSSHMDGRDTIHGNNGNDEIHGGDNWDFLYGNAGNDRIYGEDGTDLIDGGSGLNTLVGGDGADLIWGGEQADLICGAQEWSPVEAGNANDTLYGYGGPDTLYGGNGDDEIHGGTGIDWLVGESGNDTLMGEAGNDFMDGGKDNDLMDGGVDNDNMEGGEGFDTMTGGIGNDTLYGATWENNYTYQDAGNFLFGNDGDDNLYGGNGSDDLRGEAGDDGLFGGAGTNMLSGGADDDRFLTWTSAADTISDKRPEDATIRFVDSPAMNNVAPPSGWPNTIPYNFNAGTWTANEIWAADVAFNNLHHRTHNTKLLAMPNDSEYTFTRRGQQTSGDWNYGGQNFGNGSITIGQLRNATLALDTMQQTIYHEIGHSWGTSDVNANFGAFLKISGWVENPKDTKGLTQGTDTNSSLAGNQNTWWYNSKAVFARPYAQLSPAEDWATTWETYFTDKYHGTLMGNTRVQAKYDNLDLLFQKL